MPLISKVDLFAAIRRDSRASVSVTDSCISVRRAVVYLPPSRAAARARLAAVGCFFGDMT
jgi:hypothetical protein